MEPMTMAMIAGGGANLLGGILGGNAAKKAAAQAAAAQEAMYQRNIKLLESVGIPSIEAQEIALKNPESVGDLVAQMQGDTELKEISTDPQLRANQMNVLAQLRELSDQGLSTVDRIALDEAGQEATQADASRRAALLSQMAQRGTADSGTQLAMQLQSIQDANMATNKSSNEMAKMAQANRMNAMNQLANQSAGMESADFNRQAQTASAQDAIQRFNAQTSNQTNQFNLTNRQNLANQAASTANQQEMYNKGLIQQDYNNRLNRATAMTGMNTQQGANQAQAALQAGAGKAQMFQNIGQGLGNIATAAGSYFGKQAGGPDMSEYEDDRDQFRSMKGY